MNLLSRLPILNLSGENTLVAGQSLVKIIKQKAARFQQPDGILCWKTLPLIQHHFSNGCLFAGGNLQKIDTSRLWG